MSRKLQDYPWVSLRREDLEGKIDFVSIFGRSGAVHLEVGSGKGTFLLNQGKAQPDANFLGIERAGRYYRYSVDRIGRWGLKNIRIIRTDAVDLITNYIPDKSVDCFHIYFPDPWPKRRHHKRHFFKPVNFQQLLRALKTRGEIKIATDHTDYFQVILELIKSNADRVEEIDFLPPAGAGPAELTGTNYERKYLKENRTIHTLAVKKIQ